MIDIVHHGGIFGSGKTTGAYITDVKPKFNFPEIHRLNLQSSGSVGVFKDVTEDYLYFITNTGSSTSAVSIYDYKTLTFIRTVNFNRPYHVLGSFMTIGDKVYVSIFSSNLNESYDSLEIYDRNTWSQLPSPGVTARYFSQVVHRTPTHVIGFMSMRASGSTELRRMDLNTLELTKLPQLTQSSAYTFYVINDAKKIVWRDFYNSSNRGVINFDGTTHTNPVPPEVYSAIEFSIGGNGKLVYGLSYFTNTNSYLHITMHYFDKDLNLLKSEPITSTQGIYSFYGSASYFGRPFVQSDGKYLIFQNQSDGTKAVKIDSQGYLVDGRQTYEKSITVGVAMYKDWLFKEGKADVYYTFSSIYNSAQNNYTRTFSKITNYIEF